MKTKREFDYSVLKVFLFVLLALILKMSLYAASDDSSKYKWYSNFAELKKAAYETQRPVIFFLGKTGCTICENVYNNILRANSSEMLNFMKENRILGYHGQDGTETKTYQSYLEVNYPEMSRRFTYSIPWIAFVKLHNEDEDLMLGRRKGQNIHKIYDAIAESGKLRDTKNTINMVKAAMATAEFKADFPSNPSAVALEFWEEASDLGTKEIAGGSEWFNTATGVECYDTGKGVAREDSFFDSKNTAREYAFEAKMGRRYIFSVTKSNAEGAEDLKDLLKKSQKMTCTITMEGAKEAAYTKTGNNFSVLDKGIFFEPTADGKYILKLKLDTAPEKEVHFALRYTWTEASETAGTFAKPLYNGVENGKWSMDYEAVIKGNKPFILYIGAVAWCPYCVCLDRLVLSNQKFKDAVKDYPLVMVDNRRRGETTGPTLLYSESFQKYAKIDETAANEKLKANLKLQHDVTDSNAKYYDDSKDKSSVPYPTLMLCRPNGDGATFTVCVRSCVRDIPVGDLDDFAETVAKGMLAMASDVGEEGDNLFEQCTGRIVLANEKFESEDGSVIGGYDVVDWREVECKEKQDWEISLQPQGNVTSENSVTLELYDESENLLQKMSGLWRRGEGPTFQWRPEAGDICYLKIVVSNQKEVVPYKIVFTPKELPPFDLQFAEKNFDINGPEKPSMDGDDVIVTLNWQRQEMTSQVGKATVMLYNSDGTLKDKKDVTFGQDGASSGKVDVSFEKLGKGLERSRESQDFEVRITPVENCRINGISEAKVRVFTLPAFVDFKDGSSVKVILAQNTNVDLNYAIKTSVMESIEDNSLVDGTVKGLTIKVSDDKMALLITGRPTDENGGSVNVQLKSGGAVGSNVTFVFEVKSLKDINPATETPKFTGRILDGEEVVGVLAVERKSTSNSFSLSVNTRDLSGEHTFTLPDWQTSNSAESVNEDGTQTVKSAASGLELSLKPNGSGDGKYTVNKKEYKLLFSASLNKATEKDYLGTYNVMLESSDENYHGYGYLVVSVGEDGLATYYGKLPDGQEIPKTNTNMIEEARKGVVSVFATTKNGSTVGGALRIIKKEHREEGYPCVSGCTTNQAMSWRCADQDLRILTPCGSAFDASKSISGQLSGSGSGYKEYRFFVCQENSNIPEYVLTESIPGDIPVNGGDKLENGKYSYSVLLPAGYSLLPGQSLKIEADKNGIINGSFNLLKKDLTEIKANFYGIAVTIPSSCCSVSPDAIAYGSVFVDKEEMSWTMRIVPYEEHVPMPALPAPTAGEMKFEDGKYVIVSNPPSEGFVTALLNSDDSGFEALANANGQISNPARTSGTFELVNVGYGMMSDAFTFKYTGRPVTVKIDGKELNVGWNCLAFPSDIHFKAYEEQQPIENTIYAYDSTKHVFVQLNRLPEAGGFFVYIQNGDKLQTEGLTISGLAFTVDDNPTSSYRLLPEMEPVEGMKIFYWGNEQYSLTKSIEPVPTEEEEAEQGEGSEPEQGEGGDMNRSEEPVEAIPLHKGAWIKVEK